MSATTQTTLTPDLGTLAQMVGCLDENGFAILSGVKASTLEAWRKRGKGPAYFLLGKNYLYPIAAVQEFITTKVRGCTAISPQSLVF